MGVSNNFEDYFDRIQEQRKSFYQEMDSNVEDVWERPYPNKWSVAETVYHLYLLLRLFRRFSVIYMPIMYPLAVLRKNKPYPTDMNNIYIEYHQKKKKPMNAPLLLNPPKNLPRKKNYDEIKKLLERETNLLKANVLPMDERIAGQIYYPDPVAHHPNLPQSIQLIGIHEQHHFNLTKDYYLS
ncbi:DinB family protein [Ornithinibacillus halophilus]|uniref:DinB superfamily protein n=1 Tax=Ornithinibacillus halophilus TaxID=930117 RepID=A0A1M5DIG7_9BACI|nr:DinB family protein [Ornithinibacillus halophilus]SHF66532.1 DinB superfamily protein [Ornithinibacillus halophilus]